MGTTLTRKHTLKNKGIIDSIFRQGHKTRCKGFTIIQLNRPSRQSVQLVICVSRKVGNAVRRNRLKRITRELLNPYIGQMPALLIAILPEQSLLSQSHHRRQEFLQKCLEKSGLWTNQVYQGA